MGKNSGVSESGRSRGVVALRRWSFRGGLLYQNKEIS